MRASSAAIWTSSVSARRVAQPAEARLGLAPVDVGVASIEAQEPVADEVEVGGPIGDARGGRRGARRAR